MHFEIYSSTIDNAGFMSVFDNVILPGIILCSFPWIVYLDHELFDFVNIFDIMQYNTIVFSFLMQRIFWEVNCLKFCVLFGVLLRERQNKNVESGMDAYN